MYDGLGVLCFQGLLGAMVSHTAILSGLEKGVGMIFSLSMISKLALLSPGVYLVLCTTKSQQRNTSGLGYPHHVLVEGHFAKAESQVFEMTCCSIAQEIL